MLQASHEFFMDKVISLSRANSRTCALTRAMEGSRRADSGMVSVVLSGPFFSLRLSAAERRSRSHHGARRSYSASFAVRRAFTLGHSSSVMLYMTVSRMKSSRTIMCLRKIPSRTAPKRSMAAWDFRLR